MFFEQDDIHFASPKRIWTKFSQPILHRTPAVIIYGAGRVGSTSLAVSLLDQGYPAVHTHSFPINQPGTNHNTILSLFLFKIMPKPFIINTFREPIDRMISHFFRRMPIYLDNPQAYQLSTKDMIKEFNRFLDSHPETDFYLNWHRNIFDYYLKEDTFSFPFDKRTGYQFVEGKHYPLLFYRMEVGNQKIEELVTEFLDLTGFKLVHYNDTKNRPFAQEYKEFKQQVKIKPNLIKKVYQTEFAQHFYGKKFEKQMLEKYS